jgi:hypothetical protein
MPAASGPTSRQASNKEHNMDKILSDHRRSLGDFEIVDFKTTAPIEALRDQVDVDVPVNLRWTWSYGSEVEELARFRRRMADHAGSVDAGSALSDDGKGRGDTESRRF